MRRTVLKLAFTDRLEYARNQGPRTPKTALIFKVLNANSEVNLGYGGRGWD